MEGRWFPMCFILLMFSTTNQENISILHFVGNDIRIDVLEDTNIKGPKTRIPTELKTNFDIRYFDFLFEHYIFWHDSIRRTIQQSTIDGAEIKSIAEGIHVSNVFIGVDWIGRNLYWTGYAENAIKAIKIDKSLKKTVYKFERDEYGYFLALNPLIGFMYRSTNNKISRVSMDGNPSSKTYIVDNDRAIYDLAVDVSDSRVYWSTERHTFVLFSSDHNGFNQRLVLTYQDLVSGMTFDRDSLYIMFFATKSLQRCNKWSAEYNCTEIMYSSKLGYQLKIYDQLSQPEGSDRQNPCRINNGGCPHFCLVMPEKPYFQCSCADYSHLVNGTSNCTDIHECDDDNGGCSQICRKLFDEPYFSCECYEHFNLLNDNKTCDRVGNLLLVAEPQVIVKYWLDTPNFISQEIPVSTMSNGGNIRSLEYDPVHQRIIWLNRDNVFRSSHIDGTDAKSIKYYKKLGMALEFFFEWLSSKLYCRMEGKNLVIINTRNLDSDFREVSVSGMVGLIGVDTFEGVFLHRKVNFKDEVVRTNLNGLNLVKTFAFNLSNIAFISTDLTHGKLLWSERFFSDYLYMSNTDGTKLKILRFLEKTQLLGTSMLGNYVYFLGFSDLLPDRIGRIDIFNSSAEDKTIKSYDIYNRMLVIKAFTTTLSKDRTEDICPSNIECWGLYNTWICLTTSMICDGITNCYGNHDERYCHICSTICPFKLMEFSCSEMSEPISYNKYISEFVRWDKHPFSNLSKSEHIFAHDCSLTSFLFNDQSLVKGPAYFIIDSLYLDHIFRQVFLSSTFYSISNVSTFILSGRMSDNSLSSGAFWGFDGLRELVIKNTDFIEFTQNTFYGLFELYSLEVKGNKLLRKLEKGVFYGLEKLINLEMFDNGITVIKNHVFSELIDLRVLTLFGNAIQYIESNAFHAQVYLEELHITGTNVHSLDVYIFNSLTSLNILDLKDNKLKFLPPLILSNLVYLELIDLRKNDMHIIGQNFITNYNLKYIYSDSFAFCCIKPSSVTSENCVARMFDVSSCENLIQNDALRIFLWIFGCMALFGNLAVILYRFKLKKRKETNETFSVFVTNLGVSDLLMGVYMLIIASVDLIYKGRYVWNEYLWRSSIMCKLSGIIAMMSSELSVFMIALITVDRFFVFKFTFGGYRLSKRSSYILTVISWTLAILISVLPAVIYPNFFSRSGVCLALPLTQIYQQGSTYSLGIFLCLNFAIFAFIIVGQIVIFYTIKSSASVSQPVEFESSLKRMQGNVARRLGIVATTDGLCWLPVGIMVIMSQFGVEIPREVYAWVIVFVLPINSALNPFIYTFSGIKTDLPHKKERHGQYKIASKLSLSIRAALNIESTDVCSSFCDELLSDFVANGVTVRDVFIILRHVVTDLQHLHSKHLIHGRISTKTIMVELKNGAIHAARFTLSNATHATVTEPSGDMEQMGRLLKSLLRKIRYSLMEINHYSNNRTESERKIYI